MFSQFGITLSDAVNIFIHQSLMVGGLPFEMRQPRYNSETEAAMREADEIATGKIQAKRYSSFSDFVADMENEDAGV